MPRHLAASAAPMQPLATVVLLALWLGAALLVTAVVAPAAFAVLPSRALAGALVGRVLPPLFIGGAIVGVASAAFASGPAAGSHRRVRIVGGAVVALLCVAAQFGIGARIATLRLAIGPSIEAVAPDDPRRVSFGRLHALSVAALGAAMLGGGAALVGASLALGGMPRAGSGAGSRAG